MYIAHTISRNMRNIEDLSIAKKSLHTIRLAFLLNYNHGQHKDQPHPTSQGQPPSHHKRPQLKAIHPIFVAVPLLILYIGIGFVGFLSKKLYIFI